MAARYPGFANVGSSTIDSRVGLNVLASERMARITYSMNDVRAQLQAVAIGETGEVVAPR